ncbi:hypothetical protein C8F04DRAFT_1227534 [Mycena alexandri]|uniref:Uncharacterized protein n=1 Tax=Mycena alexandri TaxID=1745969 RepID=A0AAD6XFR6_9AGAR|nr:hypothetical protein C8F04DRAFT_1227534 [Mycena alexandri]
MIRPLSCLEFPYTRLHRRPPNTMRVPGSIFLGILIGSSTRIHYPSTAPVLDLRCCRICDSGLGPSVNVVRTWAQEFPGKKSSARLSHNQLSQRLEGVLKQVKNERLKAENSRKSLIRAHKRIESYRTLVDVISSNDVPGLSRLLSTAKKEGWSASKTTDMAWLAIRGFYHARNYTGLDKDLATLVYEYGGDSLLHALHKSPLALPTRFAIADVRSKVSLRITVGNVKMQDILQNIEMLFKDIDVGESGKVLHTLSQDEIAGDGRLCYLEATDEIAGLCEHAAAELETFKMGSDLTAIHAVTKAVRDGRVHVGKEFSVAAISRHAPTEYGAKPIFLMPTCKHSSWQTAAMNLQMFVAGWKLSPYGEEMHGPLAAIASDGDPNRTAAMHLICMQREVKPGDPLYEYVSGLPGLNLFTSADFLTEEFDPKHNWKCIRRTLSSKQGILANGLVINKNMLAHWLERLSGYDWSGESIHALLNPKDPQHVPSTVKLLTLMADLRTLDSSDFTPAEANTYRALCILGEMFDALLDPFINPTLSLSEQIIQLAKFAHLACALFLKHGSDFMPNQLYGHLQAMVKSAIFKVAHSKVLNPSLKVFLCLLGDDVLEILFGRSRMIGGHSPNMAIDELRRRFGSALRVDQIFARWPHLEKLARRLALGRSRDVDHMSPRNFVADLTAGSCDLPLCWSEGVRLALEFLAQFGYDVDFKKLFRKKGFDLQRPHGGKYPGVSKDVADRSSLDDREDVPSVVSDVAKNLSTPSVTDILGFDGAATLAAEKARADSEPAAFEPHSVWINLDDAGNGKKVHKKSVLRTAMDQTFDIDRGKSNDRLLRVRCFSIGGDNWDRRSAPKIHDKAADQHMLKLEGLFATLVAVNTTQVALAILHCTVIKTHTTSPPTYLDAAPTAEIGLPDTKYEITGQILSLVPFSDPAGQLCWAWTTKFIGFESAKAKRSTLNSVALQRHLSICVNGRLVLPLSSPDLMPTQGLLEDVTEDIPDLPESVETTWVFSNSKLETIKASLLARASNEDIRLQIPVYGPVKEGGSFPYETWTEPKDTEPSCREQTHILYSFPTVIAPSPKDGRRKCLVCGKDVTGPDRQNHMGRHIFLSQRGIQEDGIVTPVSPDYPCGFCGKATSNGGCSIAIRSGKAVSSCREVYEFQIAAASKSTVAKPCTNVPMRCTLCTDTNWKYNMTAHLADTHPGWELTTTTETREGLTAKIKLAQGEDCRLEVSVSAALSTAEKRPALSPAGTPRRHRIARTSRATVSLDPNDLGGGDEDDADTDFTP